MRTFGLPAPITEEAIAEFDAQQEQVRGEEMQNELNPLQLIYYNEILESINNTAAQQKCFFLEGPGGCGKTFLYETLIRTLRGQNKSVLSIAWTGLAATLLPGGRTATSAFGLPFDIVGPVTCTLNEKRRKELKLLDLIIWDEISMAPRFAFDAVDNLFRDLMRNKRRPFGGKPILCGGDFRQILPVVKRGGRDQIKDACVKNCKSWPYFKKLSLTQNMRLRNAADVEFARWLLHVVGEGSLSNDDEITIPPELLSENVIDDIYGKEIVDINILHNRCILTPLNDHALKINEDVLNRMPGEMKTYLSVDFVDSKDPDDQVQFPTEFLNTLTPSGMPPHVLNLKVGAPIMLIRNLSRCSGLGLGFGLWLGLVIDLDLD